MCREKDDKAVFFKTYMVVNDVKQKVSVLMFLPKKVSGKAWSNL